MPRLPHAMPWSAIVARLAGRAALAIALALAVHAAGLAPLRAEAPARAQRPVILLEIEGAIGIATGEYVAHGLARARAAEARLVVLRLDTPGGLVATTRKIVAAILASPVPVAVYVAPEGARAASAGTYIAYAAHLAAMAKGTHLGAATPIAMGAPAAPRDRGADRGAERETKNDGEKDGLTAAERKAVNDAAAYLRTLAQLRGRNAEWAERAVRTGATLTAAEARRDNVVDLIAPDLADLLAQAHGRVVTAAGLEQRLDTQDAPIVKVPPDWRIELLSVIGDPTVAYLLLLIGIYGVIFEFWSPGAVAPGVIGGVCLLLGLGALSVLPVAFAGLGLVVLGIALLTAEALTPGVGVLGIGGLVAFVAGSVFLFDPEAARGIDYGVAWPAIAAATLVTGAFFLLALGLALRARRRPVVTGREEMIGSQGRVLTWSAGRGTVRAHGEVWAARGPLDAAPGDTVGVVGIEGLTLVVDIRPKPGSAP